MSNAATFSPCGRYRYELSRSWDAGASTLPIVMLNPSIADAEIDDPTIRRCMVFARREGFGGIRVANLFAFRAIRTAAMRAAADPVGPDNDAALTALFDSAVGSGTPVLAAWGALGAFRGREAYVRSLADLIGVQLLCLGVTRRGHPRHPLYVRGDRMMEEWRM
jgi:hypothetical protein